MTARPSSFPTAATLFVCSGALGLGYELIWIRKAALVVGASQIALSTILTSFFLGLGLGGLVVGRRLRGGRLAPLLWYGVFEIGIGLSALAFPRAFTAVESLYGALYPAAASSVVALLALRFVLLFALCLPPTFLMGGTLPLLLDGLIAEDRRIGSRTSLLYGLNILGAVGGVLATSYWAIPRLGMNGTSLAAGACNLLLGFAALVLFRRSRPLHAASDAERPRPRFAALACATGAVAIAWQVCHARFFSLLEVTTVYTTAMLLALWLLGLAAGSLALAPLLRGRADPLRVVAAAQALVPLVGLFAFRAAGAFDFSFVLGARSTAAGRMVPLETMQVLPRTALINETVDAVLVAPALRIGLVVLAPVVLLGVCLPSLIAAATPRSAALRSISGSLVFWNTLGSAAGAWLAGYVLLPLLGLHASLALLALASLAIAAAAWRAGDPERGTRAGRFALGGALAAGGAVTLVFAFGSADLTRYAIERLGLGATGARGELAEVVEGAVGTAYVYESDAHVLLASGGVAFATASKHGLSPQAIQGHLPVLFFPGSGIPARCLGIGMGSGQSFGPLLMYPIERLDVVDIFPGLVELSLRRFQPWAHGLGSDSRVRFHFDDGRHFVDRAPDASYDVISMEPPPPRADGVFSLYSVDFYRQVRRTLTDDGVFMQWLPLYRVTPDDARGILRTQVAVFPETFVLKHGDEDFMVLSFKRRPTFDREALAGRVRTFAGEHLIAGRKWSARCAHEIASVEGVLSTIVAGPESLARVAGPGPFDDDHMALSYGGGDRWLLRRYLAVVSRISFAVLPRTPFSQLAAYFDPPLDAGEAAALDDERAASLEFYNEVAPARLARWRAMAEGGRDAAERSRGHLALAAAYDVQLHKAEAFAHLRAALEIAPHNDRPADLALARRIVLDHVAVYRPPTAAFVAEMRERFPAAPLVEAMVRAWDAAERLEQERRSRYLLPGS